MTRWQTLSCNGKPHARHENGFAALDGKFYLFGGRRIQPVDVLDPATMTWSHKSPPPMEIHHFQPVTIDKELWLLGTMTGEFPRETPLETVYIYVPETDTWKTGPVIPEARRRGGAGCVLHSDGWIYVVGGIVDGHHAGTQAWFDRLNPQTGEWQVLPDAPHKRDHAPAAIVGDKLYFFAGRETGRHNGTDYNALFFATIPEVDVYDFTTGQWSTLPDPLPVPTAAGGAGVHNGLIYYVGGEAGRPEAFTEMQVFDPATGQWTGRDGLNRARHGTNAAMMDGALWIAVGSGARGGEPELECVERLPLG
ncbi:MAG: galactose oxidase [Pseudomonadota bacterium]